MSITRLTAPADGGPVPEYIRTKSSGSGSSGPDDRADPADHADAAAEVTRAMNDFVNDLKTFRADFETKSQQRQDRPMTQTMTRPALTTVAAIEAPHQKAFEDYVRSGDDDALRGLSIEGKGMSSAVNGDGGYLVDPQTAESVRTVLTSTASIRQVATVVNVEAASYDVLIDTAEMGAGWANELAGTPETTTSKIDRITIPLHELSALPKASQRLLEDAAFDIESWLASRIADTFARAEAAAFILGDGVDKPRGFLSHPIVDEQSWEWGSLGYVASGADGGFADADAIIDLIYALGAQYRANASFVMNSKTAGIVRRLKDADGRFLWSDGMQQNEPARLMGYPVMIAEDMPDVATGNCAIAFGDFGAGYTVAERPDLRLLRDPFSAKPHVLFYATKRVGGDVSDFAAIKLMKFSTV